MKVRGIYFYHKCILTDNVDIIIRTGLLGLDDVLIVWNKAQMN